MAVMGWGADVEIVSWFPLPRAEGRNVRKRPAHIIGREGPYVETTAHGDGPTGTNTHVKFQVPNNVSEPPSHILEQFAVVALVFELRGKRQNAVPCGFG